MLEISRDDTSPNASLLSTEISCQESQNSNYYRVRSSAQVVLERGTRKIKV